MQTDLSQIKNTNYLNTSMINTTLKIKCLFLALTFFYCVSSLQAIPMNLGPGDIPQALIDALRTGNTSVLSGYFNTSIELAILDKEDIYSKQQAELIVKDFFAKHVPSSFVILHKGGKEGSQYAIGNLTTSAGNFRVTLLIKQKDTKPYIHQLRFEAGNAE
jgi:hypothetical protein